MEAIGKIMKDPIQHESQQTSEYLQSFKGNLRYEHFRAGIVYYASEIMLKKSLTHKYDIDQLNEPVIRQLHLYFTNDPKCEWNLNAGLMFGGKLGCGKSLLMEAYINLSNKFSKKQTTVIHSSAILEWIKPDLRRPENFCWRAPLFVDEIGREEKEIKDFGTVYRPMINLFEMRYLHGGRTYGTTNFNWKTLTEKYGGEDKGIYIINRMREMMTMVPIPGESRRLKNEVKTNN